MAGVRGIGAGLPATAGRGRRSSTGFAGALPGEAAPEAAGTMAAASPLGLLGLQEQGDARQRDGAARQHGEAMLAALRELQAALLGPGGAPDVGRLLRLARSGMGEAAADPALREAVAAVVLRARIELARRGWPDSE